MEGFNESDSIPSFNTSALIEEDVDTDDDSEQGDEAFYDQDMAADDDEDSVAGENISSSSSDSNEGAYFSLAKRLKRDVDDKNSFKSKVMNVLKQSFKVSGEFASSGKLKGTPLIAISLKNKIDGGANVCIKFPLQNDEAHEIIKYFDPSPYGKGTQTIVDASVRNSLQLSPDRFEILNPEWDKYIKTTLASHIKMEMSLECSFVPSLYKLLLYQPGSFFKSHRDSEKEDNMFGTLVIQLPSKFKGGQLVVRHDGKVKLFDFSTTAANNLFNTFFTAFYCDCEHEILPVTEGYRLCLVYNLIATDAGIPLAPQSHALEQELVRLLRHWDGSRKIVYALKHKYSEANLSFDNLKTTDKIVANFLKRASSKCELNIFLALFTKECSGYDPDGDEDEDCSGGCAADFDGDFSGDCDEVSYLLSTLISDGNNEKIGSSQLEVHFKKEVIPLDCFDSVGPCEQDCEHTGNEGVNITKSYRTAAIVFWPKEFTIQVLKSSNASQSVIDSLFIEEAEKYLDPNCDAKTKSKILSWAQSIVSKRRFEEKGVVDIVNTIIKFNDTNLIQKLMQNGVVRSPDPFGLVVRECDKFGWEHFGASIVAMFKELEQRRAVKLLTIFFGDGNLNQEKSKVFSALLQVIFDKGNASSTYYYSQVEKAKQQKEEKEMLEPLVNAVLKLNDPKLMLNFVKSILPLHSETTTILATICENHGWEPFATIIAAKFVNKSKADQVICLTSMIQNGVLKDDKKTLCLQLFSLMFEKHQDLTNNDSLLIYNNFNRKTSAVDTIRRRQEEKELLEPLINAASILNDVQLMKNIFQRMPLHSETIPLLVKQSQIFGWNAFATEITVKFERLSQIDAIDTLSTLIGVGNFKDEKIFCFNLFQLVLGKIHMPPSHRMTQEEQAKYFKEKQEILYSICSLAENIKFTMVQFAKTKSFREFVPVLLRLVDKETNRLSPFWGAVGLHFIGELGRESIKPVEVSWKHNTSSFAACCNDCLMLKKFLESDVEREHYRIGEKRRRHLQQRVDTMTKVSQRTEHGGRGQIGVLVVTKTEKGGADALLEKTVCKSLLERLRLVMPYN